MAASELALERIVDAPIDAVFARLADIDGYNEWMPTRGSILSSTKQTSPGEPGLGSTYTDRTSAGTVLGEIVAFEQPTRLVFHWWEPGRGGRVHAEGWPGYELEVVSDHATRVRHGARLEVHGSRSLLMPVYRWLARRERTATMEALQASFRSEP
ncbi:SRPBCC family protein [Agrococcus beijingensis]|uniref:SRPBCC family protein n=1 Tax=Agrococcus beijingensis TaxID=3068634 RepID=UPI00274267BF|nr:SRPBCC family protein [Agrococcus sp. REN33]